MLTPTTIRTWTLQSFIPETRVSVPDAHRGAPGALAVLGRPDAGLENGSGRPEPRAGEEEALGAAGPGSLPATPRGAQKARDPHARRVRQNREPFVPENHRLALPALTEARVCSGERTSGEHTGTHSEVDLLLSAKTEAKHYCL